jgi:hypothetical protein
MINRNRRQLWPANTLNNQKNQRLCLVVMIIARRKKREYFETANQAITNKKGGSSD